MIKKFTSLALLGLTSLYAQELTSRASYYTGVFDDGAAEISAYHPDSKRLYIVNASIDGVEVFNISNLDSIVPIDTIDVSLLGLKAVNSVDIHGDFLALGIENSPKQDLGKIGIYNAATGAFIDTLQAGALPDMVKFSHNGQFLMAANEGEPSSDYRNDPEGSVTHVKIVGTNTANWEVTQIDFQGLNSQASQLEASGVRLPHPLNATVAQDLEPEYVAYDDTDSIAFVAVQENNAVIKIDVQTGAIIEVLGLGKKDHSIAGNGLDAVDDDSIAIQTENVFSLYMPDAISSYTVDGKSYFVTANEGDGREYIEEFDEDNETDCLANNSTEYPDVEWDDDDGCFYEAYIDEGKLSKLDLDYTVIDSASIAHLPAKLLILNTEGDTDGDDLVEEITMMGGRSFSIFDEDGVLVYDSGDDFEQKIAEVSPEFFNTTNDENVLEDRSRKKGPEPEGVELIQVNNQVFALIGIERQGGVFLYEITDPAAPRFIQYYVDRDFAAVTEEELTMTHLGPEGILYIKAEDAPEGKALVVVSNEVSGSLEFLNFEMEAQSSLKTQFAAVNFDIVNNVVTTPSVALIEVYNLEGQLLTQARTQQLDLAQVQKESVLLVKVTQGNEVEFKRHIAQ